MFIFQWIRYSNVIICYFGWERSHQLSTYATRNWWGINQTGGGGGGQPKCVQLPTGGGGGSQPKCVQLPTGRGVSRHMCTCALTMSLFMFLATFLYYRVSCFICRNLTLPLFKKMCWWETVIFLQQDQFLSSWNKLFYNT